MRDSKGALVRHHYVGHATTLTSFSHFVPRGESLRRSKAEQCHGDRLRTVRVLEESGVNDGAGQWHGVLYGPTSITAGWLFEKRMEVEHVCRLGSPGSRHIYPRHPPVVVVAIFNSRLSFNPATD